MTVKRRGWFLPSLLALFLFSLHSQAAVPDKSPAPPLEQMLLQAIFSAPSDPHVVAEGNGGAFLIDSGNGPSLQFARKISAALRAGTSPNTLVQIIKSAERKIPTNLDPEFLFYLLSFLQYGIEQEWNNEDIARRLDVEAPIICDVLLPDGLDLYQLALRYAFSASSDTPEETRIVAQRLYEVIRHHLTTANPSARRLGSAEIINALKMAQAAASDPIVASFYGYGTNPLSQESPGPATLEALIIAFQQQAQRTTIAALLGQMPMPLGAAVHKDAITDPQTGDLSLASEPTSAPLKKPPYFLGKIFQKINRRGGAGLVPQQSTELLEQGLNVTEPMGHLPNIVSLSLTKVLLAVQDLSQSRDRNPAKAAQFVLEAIAEALRNDVQPEQILAVLQQIQQTQSVPPATGTFFLNLELVLENNPDVLKEPPSQRVKKPAPNGELTNLSNLVARYGERPTPELAARIETAVREAALAGIPRKTLAATLPNEERFASLRGQLNSPSQDPLQFLKPSDHEMGRPSMAPQPTRPSVAATLLAITKRLRELGEKRDGKGTEEPIVEQARKIAEEVPRERPEAR